MTASVWPATASRRQTVSVAALVTHTEPNPTATAVGLRPTVNRSIRLSSAPIRQRDESPEFSTQAAPAPKAICAGSTPTSALNVLWTWPSARLTREIVEGTAPTKSRGGCVIQREPPPAAMNRAVRPGTRRRVSTWSVAGSTWVTTLSSKLPTNRPWPGTAARPAGCLTRRPPSRTLLLTSYEELQLVEVDVLVTGAAAVGPAPQDRLQEQHRLRQCQAGRRALGHRRSSVRKLCAQVTSAVWWWK